MSGSLSALPKHEKDKLIALLAGWVVGLEWLDEHGPVNVGVFWEVMRKALEEDGDAAGKVLTGLFDCGVIDWTGAGGEIDVTPIGAERAGRTR